MAGQQDFDGRALQERIRVLRHSAARTRVAEPNGDDGWIMPVALLGAFAVALMLTALLQA